MQIRLVKLTDGITPDLRRRYAAVADKRSIHQAMGIAVVSLAKRAWTDPGLRPVPWPSKKDGSAATLRDTGTLAKSPRLISASQGGALVGSDRHYAAIHQLGGQTPPRVIRPGPGKKALKIPGIGFRKSVKHPGSRIPARPYFPFHATGQPTRRAVEAIARVVRAKLA
jgi:phage gpG-like protein